MSDGARDTVLPDPRARQIGLDRVEAALRPTEIDFAEIRVLEGGTPEVRVAKRNAPQHGASRAASRRSAPWKVPPDSRTRRKHARCKMALHRFACSMQASSSCASMSEEPSRRETDPSGTFGSSSFTFHPRLQERSYANPASPNPAE